MGSKLLVADAGHLMGFYIDGRLSASAEKRRMMRGLSEDQVMGAIVVCLQDLPGGKFPDTYAEAESLMAQRPAGPGAG